MLRDRLAQAAIDRRRLKNNRASKIARELTERKEDFSIGVVRDGSLSKLRRSRMFIV